MEFTLKKANEYIEKNKNAVNKKFYPEINFSAPIGWINDPNGVSISGEYYHLFYQYYPYGAFHGPMHWGHAKTKDGLNWEHLPVALAPDMVYDKNGVFSGSGLVVDDKFYLMYTGHLTEAFEGEVRQNQNIAISEDFINFEKYENNPVLDEKDLPKGVSKEDFRDPKVFVRDGKYYAVIGSKDEDKIGLVLLYESTDMLSWTYKSILLKDEAYLGDMPECPDLLLFEDDRAALVVSAMNYKYKGQTYPHKTMIIDGEMDWENFEFIPESTREMDFGFDYYAPQSARENDGYFLIAWSQSWGTSLVPGEKDHKWMGQMTIPQSLFIKDGLIKRTIHPKVLANKKLVTEYKDLKGGKCDLKNGNYIEFEIEKKNIESLDLNFVNDKEAFDFKFDLGSNKASFDRTKLAYPIKSDHDFDINKKTFEIDYGEKIKFQIIVDRSSIQIYINGDYSITNTYYSEDRLKNLDIEIIGQGLVEKLEIFDLLGDR